MHFFTHKVAFLGYIVSSEGIKADESKFEAIQTWPLPQSIHDVQSFHGLASFYRRFIRNFSTIMASMTEVIKATSFKWIPKAQSTFEEVKRRLIQAPVLLYRALRKSLKLNVMHLVLVYVVFLLKKVSLGPSLVRNCVIQHESIPPMLRSFMQLCVVLGTRVTIL